MRLVPTHLRQGQFPQSCNFSDFGELLRIKPLAEFWAGKFGRKEKAATHFLFVYFGRVFAQLLEVFYGLSLVNSN